jgi:hypothetical protein
MKITVVIQFDYDDDEFPTTGEVEKSIEGLLKRFAGETIGDIDHIEAAEGDMEEAFGIEEA